MKLKTGFFEVLVAVILAPFSVILYHLGAFDSILAYELVNIDEVVNAPEALLSEV